MFSFWNFLSPLPIYLLGFGIFFLLIYMSFHIKSIFILICLPKRFWSVVSINCATVIYDLKMSVIRCLLGCDCSSEICQALFHMWSSPRIAAQGDSLTLGHAVFLWWRVKIRRTGGDIYWLLMLLLWTGIWNVCSCIISQSKAGKYTPLRGMHGKSCGSGREWIILSPKWSNE